MNSRAMVALTNPNTHYTHEGSSFTGSPNWDRWIQWKKATGHVIRPSSLRLRNVDINKSNMLIKYEGNDSKWHKYRVTEDQLNELLKFMNIK